MRLARSSRSTGFAEDDVLAMAAAAGIGSEHPVARAVIDGARQRSIEIPPADGARSSREPARSARVAGHVVVVGRPEHLPDDLALRSIGRDGGSRPRSSFA